MTADDFKLTDAEQLHWERSNLRAKLNQIVRKRNKYYSPLATIEEAIEIGLEIDADTQAGIIKLIQREIKVVQKHVRDMVHIVLTSRFPQLVIMAGRKRKEFVEEVEGVEGLNRLLKEWTALPIMQEEFSALAGFASPTDDEPKDD